MGGLSWSPAMIDALLTHINDNKSDQSIYLTNKDEAYIAALSHLQQNYPHQTLTVSQVEDKVNRTFAHERQSRYNDKASLFRLGRAVLGRSCDTDQLLEREKNGWEGIRGRGGKSPFAPGFRPDPEHVVDVAEDEQPSDRQRRLSTNTIEISDDSSGSSLAQGTSDTLHSRRSGVGSVSAQRAATFQAIDQYLVAPVVYLPSIKELNGMKSEILHWIEDCVHVLLKEAKVKDPTEPQFSLPAKHGSSPMLFEALKSKEFFGLCRPIFGASAQAEVYEKACVLQLLMRDFLRSVIGVAVWKWVFEGGDDNFPSLPGKFRDTDPPSSSMYQCAVEDGKSFIPNSLHSLARLIQGYPSTAFPELHRTILLKTNRRFVDEKIEWEQHAIILSHRLMDALLPLLSANDLYLRGRAVLTWRDHLNRLFADALKFRYQVLQLGPEYVFEWPRSGDEFMTTTMEAIPGTDEAENRKVKMSLFPAVMRRRSRGPGLFKFEESTEIRATVLVQNVDE